MSSTSTLSSVGGDQPPRRVGAEQPPSQRQPGNNRQIIIYELTNQMTKKHNLAVAFTD